MEALENENNFLYQNLQKFNNSKNEDESFKYIKKSVSYEYECVACGEKISYKLTFDLIEENNEQLPQQYIVINAKPLFTKTKYIDRDSYIHGIKKSFTYSNYREKFNLFDFKDSCFKYSNMQDSNLLNIYNDLIKSVKKNNSRIRINKFHLIFNYYLSDFSNWDNLIMLALDNEKEYDILECYEEANKKTYKIQYLNEKNQDSQSQYEFQSKISKIKNSPNSFSNSLSKTDIKIHNHTKNNSNHLYVKNYNNEENINYDNNSDIYENNFLNDNDNYTNNIHMINNKYDSFYQRMNDIRDKKVSTSNSNGKFPSSRKKNKKSSSGRSSDEINYKEKEEEKGIYKINTFVSKINHNSNTIEVKLTHKKNNLSNNHIRIIKKDKKNKKNFQKLNSLIENKKEKNNEKSQKLKAEKKKEKNKRNYSENKIYEEKILNENQTKSEKDKITKKLLYEEYNFPMPKSVDEKEKKNNKLKKSKKNKKKENNQKDSFPFQDDDEVCTDIKEKKSKNIRKKISQKEKNSLKQTENPIGIDLENISGNKNKNNLLGHKINRTQEKNNNKINKKEKKIINKKRKKFLTEKKNKINTIPIIAIFESDDENRNKIKNISQTEKKSKNNEKRINNTSPSDNAKDNYFEIGISGKTSKSKLNVNKIINSNKNKRSPSPLSQSNISKNQKENLSNNKLLLKFMSQPSDIIKNINEIKLLKDKIEKCNDLYFKLVYTSIKDKDDYHTFKYSLINNYRHLILIKTTKEKRFGIYFTEQLFCSKSKQNQEIIDMMGFIFSFEKCKFYEPNERLICFTQSPQLPYLFKLSDFSICIKNNFLSCKHHLGQTNRVFNIKNLYDELNGGEKEYSISVLEVYRVEIPNK